MLASRPQPATRRVPRSGSCTLLTRAQHLSGAPEPVCYSRPIVLGSPTSVRLGGEALQTADQELDRQTVGVRPRGPIIELGRGAREVGELAGGQPFHGCLLAVGARRKIA